MDGGPGTGFINKLLLKHSHTYSFMYYLWLSNDMVEQCDREHITCSLKIITLWPFKEKNIEDLGNFVLRSCIYDNEIWSK